MPIQRIIKFLEDHWLLSGALGVIMGHFLDIPQIIAGSIIYVVLEALLLLTENLFGSELYRYKAYIGVMIIYVFVVLFGWELLVYLCDRDNPLKQPLRTAAATVEIKYRINDKSNINFTPDTTLILYNKKHHPLLTIDASDGFCVPIENYNKCRYQAKAFNIATENIGEPISDIIDANELCIILGIPKDSNITDGNVIFTFNGSLQKIIHLHNQISVGEPAPSTSRITLHDIDLKKGN